MEIKENKFKKIVKKYGVLSMACVFAVAIAVTVAFGSASPDVEEPVSTVNVEFGLPMADATIVKDYSEEFLQFNENLNRWEIHLALDMTAENATVMSVSDGVVASIETNSLDGNIVTVNHADGFVSVYSSLDDEIAVSVGQSVMKGQKIGEASISAANEAAVGGHLHFALFKDGVEVDPNNYLDLQNK